MFGKGYPIEGKEKLQLDVEDKYIYVHTGTARSFKAPEPDFSSSSVAEDIFERIMAVMN